MATIIDHPNSVWPNGLKVDSEGYVTFYPLGTNKVDISTITWPDGDELVSPFVYKNDKLVGFIDTKALTVSGSATTTMNYSHIEADFSSIVEGMLTVDAPNASVKKFSWAVSAGSNENFDFIIIDFNTADSETINTIRTAKRLVHNELYDAEGGLIGTIDTSKIEIGGIFNEETNTGDGVFCNMEGNASRGLILSEFNSDLSSLKNGNLMFYNCSNLNLFTSDLSSLTNGYGMFYKCTNLSAISSDLPSLTNGYYMFYNCTNLEAFSSDLSSLTNGYYMFRDCTNLTSFTSDLSNLTNGSNMFRSCSKLESFNSDLSSLTNGYYMFRNCTNLTSFTSDLSSLTNGNNMFRFCENLTSFTSDLSSLTDCQYMFAGTALTSFSSNLSSLTNGDNMFDSCTNLTSFSSDLSNLTNGQSMFAQCTNLESFTADLSSLTDGDSMFLDTKFTSFNLDLSSLTNGNSMFNYCDKLISFSSNLSSLRDGDSMFYRCPNLTSFSSDLPSLTYGTYMFRECKLDAPSVKNIIDTINTYSAKLSLGMGCNNTTEDKDLFAQEIGYTDMASLLAALQAKGWTADARYNGRPATTYGLRRPSENTLPVFVKLEEVEETEKHIDYTSEDGSKKYILDWFHETTGSTDGYTQFNSIEEAIETLNIKPIERN